MDATLDPAGSSPDSTKTKLQARSSPPAQCHATTSDTSQTSSKNHRLTKRGTARSSQTDLTSRRQARRRSSSDPDTAANSETPESGPRGSMTTVRSSLSGPIEMPTTFTPTTHRISRAKKGKHLYSRGTSETPPVQSCRGAIPMQQPELSQDVSAAGLASEAYGETVSAGGGPKKIRHILLTMFSSESQAPNYSVGADGVDLSPTARTPPMSRTPFSSASPEFPSTVAPAPSSMGSTSPQMNLPPQTHNMLQINIPSNPIPIFTPEILLGGSDESPLYSSNSSNTSTASPHASTPRYSIPMWPETARNRSISTISAPEQQWTYLQKSPVASGLHMPVWSMEESLPAPPQLMPVGFDTPLLQSVGIPALNQPALANAQCNPAPLRLPESDFDGDTLYELRFLMLGWTGMSVDPLGIGPRILLQVEGYVERYWQCFDHLVPIVHRASFNWRDAPAVLVAAMASIGAQCSDSVEARRFALDVHRRCRELMSEKYRTVAINSRSPLSDLQAILLLEFLGLFRSLRINVTPSEHFESLYHSLIQDSLREIQDHGTEAERLGDEMRRRMLLAAFLLDTQRTVLFQQPVSIQSTVLACVDLPLASPEAPWCQGSAGPAAPFSKTNGAPPGRLSGLMFDLLSTSKTVDVSSFDASLMLAHAMMYPDRSDAAGGLDVCYERLASSLGGEHGSHTVSYHAYKMIPRVPLHDLLAVTGESWVLGMKLNSQAEFSKAKGATRTWARGPDSAIAVRHATHILHSALTRSRRMNFSAEGLHAQWCAYVAALVCWAYGSCHSCYGDSPDGGPIDGGHGLWAELWSILGPETPPPGGTCGILDQVRNLIKGSHSGLLREAEEVLAKLCKGNILL
ncbi:MAG: hypothetical protein M1825_005007 [Sarcosagium campestre]|nr:MAG: hypothetical protein M1825_005007 [Sarcosagium campestre]